MSIYIGNKEIKHIFKGSTLVKTGGVKIWEDTHLNSAGTATIEYTEATGSLSVIATDNSTFYHRSPSSFSNLSTTDTVTLPENAANTLRILPILTSGSITVTINASKGLNAVTKLILGMNHSNEARMYLNLPAMPNLVSIDLASSWSGYVTMHRTISESVWLTILKLLPKSEVYNQLLILKN